MAALPGIRTNRDAIIRREKIAANYDCVVVDDFLQNPDDLVDFADKHVPEFSHAESGYPGRQLPVDSNAIAEVHRFVRTNMSKQHSFLRGGLNLWALLSMVTLQPEQLTGMQRVCHSDPNPNPRRKIFAGVIYLFENEALGGTGFYRWKDQDVRFRAATVEKQDAGSSLALLQEHFPSFRGPARYMTDTNEVAEHLITVPARFNRMIFYSGEIPHSGAITSPELLSTDVRKARLTLNIFASVLPSQNAN